MIDQVPARRSRPKPQTRLTYTPFGPERVAYSAPGRGYASVGSLSHSGKPAAVGGSADSHLRYDQARLRAESQYFDRNNALYQGIINRIVDVVLGNGLTLHARTGRKKANAIIEKDWREWWGGTPEIRGLDSGPDLERKFVRHYAVDGDFGAYLDDASETVQLIVSELINSNKQKNPITGNRIENGVELDRVGRPIRFWIADFDQYGNANASNAKAYSANDIIFIANRRRSDQTRGEPLLQSVYSTLHALKDYADSTVAAAQLLSRFAVKITKEKAEEISEFTSVTDTSAGTDDLADRVHDIGDAIIFWGKPGESIDGIEHNIPGGNFTETVKFFLRLAGMPIGMTLEFTFLIWSDTNYSSGRASAKQVERSLKSIVQMLRKLMAKIYRWRIDKLVKDGLIPANTPDLYSHEFHPQPYPFIDPQKEAQAQKERLETGTTSISREIKDQGDDPSEVFAEQANDLDEIATLCEAHNKKHPTQPVTIEQWTAFIRQGKAGTAATPGAVAEPAKPAQPDPEDEPADDQTNNTSDVEELANV